MEWYLKVLKNYANFTGRARRKEYWMFVLFNIIFAVLAIILDNILSVNIEGGPYGLFYLLYGFFIIIPSLSVAVRRLHDTGNSGWMILVGLIPLIGSIWLLVLYVTEGDMGGNKYGENPKKMEVY